MAKSRYYRAQPNGLSLFGHRSKLGSDPVHGIFAYEDPSVLFRTYSWLHIRKRLPQYEMLTFEGKLVDRPEDSEGVVVLPTREISRIPMSQWLRDNGYDDGVSIQTTDRIENTMRNKKTPKKIVKKVVPKKTVLSVHELIRELSTALELGVAPDERKRITLKIQTSRQCIRKSKPKPKSRKVSRRYR